MPFNLYEERVCCINSMMDDLVCSYQKNEAETVDVAKGRSEILANTTQFSEMGFRELTLFEIRLMMLQEAKSQQPLVTILEHYLNTLIERNECSESEPITCFHGDPAGFTPAYYVRRIAKYNGASPCCFVSALIYLERICRKKPALHLNKRTLQRLLLIVTN